MAVPGEPGDGCPVKYKQMIVKLNFTHIFELIDDRN